MSDRPTPRTDAFFENEWDGTGFDMRQWAEQLERELSDAKAEIARMTEQLPDGMKHCKIVFHECGNGHGWLEATNWIHHECPWCQIARLTECVRAADILSKDRYDSPTWIRNWYAYDEARKSVKL